MECTLCDAEVDGIDDAIDAGWIPYFYVLDVEHAQVCPACFDTYLQFDEEGECEMKPEFVNTFLATASAAE